MRCRTFVALAARHARRQDKPPASGEPAGQKIEWRSAPPLRSRQGATTGRAAYAACGWLRSLAGEARRQHRKFRPTTSIRWQSAELACSKLRARAARETPATLG